MKAAELRSKTAAELQQELLELRKEQFALRMQRGTSQLANPARFKVLKKDIARIKTVLQEISLAKDAQALTAQINTN